MGYSVYILVSLRGNRYYVGSSSDPERRLHVHNTVEKGFTARYRPWRLVYRRDYPAKADAQQAERRIKNWKSRVMIERLIAGEITL